MDRDYFIIKGIVRHRENGKGIEGVLVEAYDADLFFDDKLGSSATDAEGAFEIRYQASDFRDLFERCPDIYLTVRNKDGCQVSSTKERIKFNASREEYFLINVSTESLEGQPVDTETIGGLRVNKQAFKEVAPADLIALARAYHGEQLNERQLTLFQKVNPLLVDHLIVGEESPVAEDCLTPQIGFLEAALRHSGADQHILDLLDAVLYDLPLTVYETSHFSIHYSVWEGEGEWTADTGTVLSDDAPAEEVRLFSEEGELIGTTEAGTGIPTYIQKLAIWLEYGFNRYTQDYQLRDPRLNTARIYVSVAYIEGAVSGYGGCGFIAIDNNLDDEVLAGSAVHELFHCVQSQYQSSPGSVSCMQWHPYIMEGMTRCVEDTVNDSLNRWMKGANSYFSENWRTGNISLLDLSYRAALFWKYMTEQHSTQTTAAHEPAIGIDLVRKACEMAGNLGEASINIPIALRSQFRVPFFGTFRHFIYLSSGNRELSTDETTFGNWLAANYLQCLRNTDPDLDRRFTYMEARERGPEGQSLLNCMTNTTQHRLEQGGAVNIEEDNTHWSAEYHELQMEPEVDSVKISFSAYTGFDHPLVQLLLIEQGDTFGDLIRFDRSFTKTVKAHGLKKIVIVAGACDTGGSYTIRAQAVDATSDVMITRWNSVQGQEHEFDPIDWSWHWISPDIWVDNSDGESQLHERSMLRFEWDNPRGGSNHLYIRLRNKGTKKAENVFVRFYYQDASAELREDAWQPVWEDGTGAISQLSGLILKPGEEIRPYVSWWLPKPDTISDDTSFHYCVKVVVESSSDINTNNKMAFSNFCFVEEPPPEIIPEYAQRFNMRVWADWFPRTQLVPYVPDEWYIWRDQMGKAPSAEIYVIPHNNPSLMFDQKDFLRMHQIELQEIRREAAMSPVPSHDEKTMGTPGLRTASRLYRLRFILRNDEERVVASRGRFHSIENTLPPNVTADDLQTTPDPRTLPPGMVDIPMATVVQVVRGEIIGGVTFAIIERNQVDAGSRDQSA
jgi:hypothetical protein